MLVIPVRRNTTTNDKQELCDKIRSLYPDPGECGIDVTVTFSEEKNFWVVDFKKDDHELTTHLELQDANDCLNEKNAFIQELK